MVRKNLRGSEEGRGGRTYPMKERAIVIFEFEEENASERIEREKKRGRR